MDLESKPYRSPRWSWEILDCAMPMTFDTYSNCAHQCVYCFAFFQRGVGTSADDYMHHRVKSVDVDWVKKLFRLDPSVMRSAGDRSFGWYIKNRYVLQWGGLSDGFDWYERKFRVSLELLKFFVEMNYPISISTKGTWFVDDPEYQAVLRGAKNVHIKYSIITDDPQAAQKLEAGTATPDDRFQALEKLNALGIGATTLRFRPFVIGVSEKSIDRMFQRAKDTGCYSITTEFLCIESRATPNHHARYKAISDVVGYDVWSFYRANSAKGGGLLRLNYDIKRPYIQHMQDVATGLDIPFFVSDAHHKEASAGGGCCGLPTTGVLSNYNRGQYSEAMQIAKQNGVVYRSDIAPFAEGLKEIPYATAPGYNKGTTLALADKRYHSMFDFMRDTWNTPKGWSSPARYFGGALVPSGVDSNGDVIYIYNQPFIDAGIRVDSVQDLQQRMGLSELDGGVRGHVAFPIFADVEQSPGLETQLNGEHLAYEPISGADAADTIRQYLAENGLIHAWLVRSSIQGSLRAVLSQLEGILTETGNVPTHPGAVLIGG